ncbi:hypothetical protein CsSME_00031689 [Camellia sinensis var. sinensis]
MPPPVLNSPFSGPRAERFGPRTSVLHPFWFIFGKETFSICNCIPHILVHRVTEVDNKLGVGQPFPGGRPEALTNINLYAAEKELYLGSKCQVEDKPNPWQFWMIMLKSGNMDTYAANCPKNGHRIGPYGPNRAFPCFGKGCMNQPLIYHDYTTLQGPNITTLRGRFFGSWDLDADLRKGIVEKLSYYSVTWEKELARGSPMPQLDSPVGIITKPEECQKLFQNHQTSK